MAARNRVMRIPVKDKQEGEAIARALDDPMTRAFIIIVGTLSPLGERARTRVLSFVNDKLNEDAGAVTITTHGDRHELDARTRAAARESWT